MGENLILERAREYLGYERVEENRRQIEEIINEPARSDELRRLFDQRLLFGTAGLRGKMGPGYNQLNDLVIIQTSQGLSSYLAEQFSPEDCVTRGVLIGHDARHNSARFARLAAAALLHRNIRVRFCEDIIPTPLVAFGVTRYKCLAGIVVTASHNPKDDNGYKVYWSNGAQILSPHDKNIQRHIELRENLKPWPNSWITESSDLVERYPKIFEQVHVDLVEKYFRYIERKVVRKFDQDELTRIAYTAMHGVGHEYLTRALKMANFKDIFPVQEQLLPDPNFPTVKFPNPEEHGALDLAFETAAKEGASLILANDPDADRCAAALYNPQTKESRVLNGNELGSLLGWWLWHTRKDRDRKPAERYYMLSTAVSSRFLQSMAEVEGFRFVETLTGFKYMGNMAEKILLESADNEVLFAYEEAIGYMVNSEILDKDGITAALQVAQCAEYLNREKGVTLVDQLDWLYAKYGYHYTMNSYYLCYDKVTIERIFKNLQNDYPADFGDQYPVTRVRDLNNGYDSSTKDQKPLLPTSSSSFMVTFFIGNGEIVFTIRTSGTEPKIKYYSEIVSKPSQGEDFLQVKRATREKLEKFLKVAIERCLSPNLHNLKPAADN